MKSSCGVGKNVGTAREAGHAQWLRQLAVLKTVFATAEGRAVSGKSERVTKPEGLSGSTISLHRKSPRRVEHFWFCDRCASFWTLL
jgi:hypothetical protein